MAKTSAERQAAYRAKRADQSSTERRLNTWISAETYQALEALAKRYGVTKRFIIQLLVSHETGQLSELKVKGEDTEKRTPNKLLRNADPKIIQKKVIEQPALPASSAHSKQIGFEF